MCLKFLVLGDLHLSTTNPANRIDDIKLATMQKFDEIQKICNEHKVSAILCTGDIFNGGQVSNATLLFAFELFKPFTIPIYTAVGNHDLFNYNINTLQRTSLIVLSKMLHNFHVICNKDDGVAFADKKDNVANVTFQEFTNDLDTEKCNGYTADISEYNDDIVHIRVVHGMLLDHKPPFDKYTLLHEVETTQNVVISGHDHLGYGTKKYKNTTFINPGSLLRLSASKAEIKRKITVGLIEIKYKQATVSLIELKSAQDGSSVLSRESIEKAKERTYAMDTFSTLLKGDAIDYSVDILTVLEEVAKVKAEEKRVIDKARELILENINRVN